MRTERNGEAEGRRLAPGQDAKLGLGETGHRGIDRLAVALLSPLQMGPQIGGALFHLVSQFAPREGRQRGITELLPSGAKPILQGAYVLIQDFWLGHAAAISRCDQDPELLILAKTPRSLSE